MPVMTTVSCGTTLGIFFGSGPMRSAQTPGGGGLAEGAACWGIGGGGCGAGEAGMVVSTGGGWGPGAFATQL